MKKLLALGVAAVAVMLPASSALAADYTRLEGPTASLSNIFTAFAGGVPSTSGGGPITIGGQQIDLQSQGSTNYRVGQDGDRELKWTLQDWNVNEGDPVFTILIDTGALFGPVVGNGGVGQLFSFAPITLADNDGSAKLDVRSKDGDEVPYLSKCGTLEIMIPFSGNDQQLGQISDIGIGTLTETGDPADFGLFNGNLNCVPNLPNPNA